MDHLKRSLNIYWIKPQIGSAFPLEFLCQAKEHIAIKHSVCFTTDKREASKILESWRFNTSQKCIMFVYFLKNNSTQLWFEMPHFPEFQPITRSTCQAVSPKEFDTLGLCALTQPFAAAASMIKTIQQGCLPNQKETSCRMSYSLFIYKCDKILRCQPVCAGILITRQINVG